MPPGRPGAVKFLKGSDDTLDILAIPFGGPLPGGNGKGVDTDGEFFSDQTDLCPDWFPVQRPLLYQHGLDERTSAQAIGRVHSETARKEADGWWVQAQLDKRSRYFEDIKRLIEGDSLSASSGAMAHLVKRTADGEIVRWPWVELSLTPTPANLYARVQPVEVAKHYKAAGITPPPTIDEDDTRSYADLLDRLTDDSGDFLDLTQRLAEGRTKVGRALSQRRRTQLLALAEQWESGASDLRQIVAEAETAPKPEERATEGDAPAADEDAGAPQQGEANEGKAKEGAAAHAPPELAAIFAKFQEEQAFYAPLLTPHKR